MRRRFPRYSKIAAAVAAGTAVAAWIGSCNTVLDAGSFTFGSCDTKGERTCVDNALQECGADGTWVTQALCQGTTCDADAGGCVGVCAPGARRCDPDGGASYQTCNAGQWDQGTGCTQAVCVDGGCTICVPGAFSCSASREEIIAAKAGDWLIFCDQQGVWETPQPTPCPCPNGGCCVNGGCAECAPGKMGCIDKLQATCDDDGYWPDAGVPCQAGTSCDYSTGQCLPPCIPHESECVDGGFRMCNDGGTWDTTECPNPCQPCINGACHVAPGTSCTANCITVGRCSPTGTCEAAFGGAVVCADVDDALCNVSTCDKDSGRCSVPNGDTSYTCDSGDLCSTATTCLNGVCTGADHAWAHWSFKAAQPMLRFAGTSQVVYDNVTHLMWQRTPSTGTFTYQDASSYCSCLNLSKGCQTSGQIAGYPEGWRLPTRIELASIVSYDQASSGGNALIDPSFDLPSTWQFWSASAKASMMGGSSAWSVNFGNGWVTQVGEAMPLAVRCVR